MRYKLSDKEINELLKHLNIVCDTREQKNIHVLKHFKKFGIPYKIQKLDQGDYSCMIPHNEETAKYGIKRDIYFDTYVERKADSNEIVGNLLKNNGTTFINELIRLQGSKFIIFVEDLDFERKVATGDYISKYDSKAFRGRLESLKMKYGFEIQAVDKELIGYLIHQRFHYQARHFLKSCIF